MVLKRMLRQPVAWSSLSLVYSPPWCIFQRKRLAAASAHPVRTISPIADSNKETADSARITELLICSIHRVPEFRQTRSFGKHLAVALAAHGQEASVCLSALRSLVIGLLHACR